MSRVEFTGLNGDLINAFTEDAKLCERAGYLELAQSYRDARWQLWDAQNIYVTPRSRRDYWKDWPSANLEKPKPGRLVDSLVRRLP